VEVAGYLFFIISSVLVKAPLRLYFDTQSINSVWPVSEYNAFSALAPFEEISIE
jgi:hypothetical protein